MNTVLMIGGTGRLGQPVAQALARAGYRVRILKRDLTHIPNKLPEQVEWRQGDLQQPASLAKALAGCDAVYLNLPDTSNPRAAFIPERDGVANVLNVIPPQTLIIKLSAIDATETPQYTDLTLKYRSEERIRASGNPFMIFRPTWFMESLPLLLTSGKRLYHIGPQPAPLYWIAGRDYAAQVVAALQNRPLTENRIFTVQGPEALTFAEAAQRYIRISGNGHTITRLPLWLVRLGGLFDVQTHANYEVMAHFNRRREVFASEDTWRLLGQPTTTIETFAADWAA